MPSVQMVNLETGETTSFGDGGIIAGSYHVTDMVLTEQARSEGYNKLEALRENGSKRQYQQKKPNLSLIKNEPPGEFKPASNSYPPMESPYNESIGELLKILQENYNKGALRGIAISYIIMEDEGNTHGCHSFTTDGRGINNLNTGIDLLKSYIVDHMREQISRSKL
jgi:hypothetical protein